MIAGQFPILLAQNEADGGVLIFGLILTLCGLAGFVLWLWALVHAIRNPALDGNLRVVWILVIVFTGFIGAILVLARSSSGICSTEFV